MFCCKLSNLKKNDFRNFINLLLLDSYTNSEDSVNLPSLEMPFEIGKYKLSDIKFRNVTKLDFGPFPDGRSGKLFS
jgi:hypothetical protein